MWEHRSPKAMMPLTFFRIPAFSAGNTVAFSVSLGMFSIFLFVTLYMQAIRGYTPFETGLRFLPMTVMIIVTAPIAGHVAQRIGPRIPMTYGLTMASAGLLGLTLITPTTPFWMIAILFVMMGHGLGATMAPMTAAVMGAVGPQRAGLGSAMTNTSREVGGVLGIALLGTVLFDRLGSTLAPEARRARTRRPVRRARSPRPPPTASSPPAELAGLGLTPRADRRVRHGVQGVVHERVPPRAADRRRWSS